MKKIFLLQIILFIMFSCNIDKINKEKNAALSKEYPYLKREDSISGRIDTLFTFVSSTPKGTLYFKLKNGDKFRGTVTTSSNKVKSSLYDFLEKDDFITKPSGVDSIYVLKNRMRYSFFLPTQEYHDSIFDKNGYLK